MLAFSHVHPESGSDQELVQNGGCPHVKKTLGMIGVLLVVFGLASMRFSNQCINLNSLQGKTELNVDDAILKTTKKLLKVKDHSLAESTVLKAMKQAGHNAQKDWEKHHVRKLDTLAVLKGRQAIRDFRRGQHSKEAGHVECAFNILEAFLSVVGMGDDINGIIRTCPPPRDGESELACQVDSSMLVAWVGNAAAKISLAASNCALTLNVDSVCAAGVSGLVSALGRDCCWCLFDWCCVHTYPSFVDYKPNQRLGRPYCPNRPQAFDRPRTCWQWCAVWRRCWHGGCQHCKHGTCNQQSGECKPLRQVCD